MADIHALLLPLLRLLPPEAAHRAAVRALALGLGPRDRVPDPPSLATTVWGLGFRNPVGLSAGFDKGAEVPDALLAAGFGFVETGTVTLRPQPGNPRPRLFRLTADRAVVNRLGFNGGGIAPYAARLSKRRPGLGPVGANVGRNKDSDDAAADYAACVRAAAPHADFVVINVSSPNTPRLRRLQEKAALADLLARAAAARAAAGGRAPPLIVKISPDLGPDARAGLAEAALACGVDGLTVANTTVARPAGMTDPRRTEAGGLSGAPLFPIALEAVRDMRRLTGGRVPIIGSGGVASGADAYAMIRAGASLVQIYTALVFRGPGLVPEIKAELAALLARDGFASVADAVGADAAPPPGAPVRAAPPALPR